MKIGWFGRCFNYEHKSLSTKTHIIVKDKVLCGYKPHKTLEFQFCASGSSPRNLDYVECKICKREYLKLIEKALND